MKQAGQTAHQRRLPLANARDPFAPGTDLAPIMDSDHAKSLVVASRCALIADDISDLLNSYENSCFEDLKTAQDLSAKCSPLVDRIDEIVAFANGDMHQVLRQRLMEFKEFSATLNTFCSSIQD